MGNATTLDSMESFEFFGLKSGQSTHIRTIQLFPTAFQFKVLFTVFIPL